MLAIQVNSNGGPENLLAVDMPVPEPGPEQVLIRHEAIGVNYIDTYHRSGLYTVATPFIPGMEAAGIIEKAGKNAHNFSVGERVVYSSQSLGGYAELNAVEEERVVALPADIDFISAAASFLKGLTAQYLVRQAFRVESGHTVLLHAAAGATGMLIAAWLKWLGAEVIATVGSDDKAKLVSGLNLDHVVNYTAEDFAVRVAEITSGRGVDVVFDGVGAATFDGSLKSLKRRGMLVSFGNASGPVPAIEPLALMKQGSVYLTRPQLSDFIIDRESLAAASKDLFAAIQSGAIAPQCNHKFEMEAAVDAHRALESRRTQGSIVLLP